MPPKRKIPFVKILGVALLIFGLSLLAVNILSFSNTLSVPGVIHSVQQYEDYKYHSVEAGTNKPCKLWVRLYTDNRIILTKSDYEPCGYFIVPSFKVGQDVTVRMIKDSSEAEIDYGRWILIVPAFLIVFGLYMAVVPHPFGNSES